MPWFDSYREQIKTDRDKKKQQITEEDQEEQKQIEIDNQLNGVNETQELKKRPDVSIQQIPTPQKEETTGNQTEVIETARSSPGEDNSSGARAAVLEHVETSFRRYNPSYFGYALLTNLIGLVVSIVILVAVIIPMTTQIINSVNQNTILIGSVSSSNSTLLQNQMSSAVTTITSILPVMIALVPLYVLSTYLFR